MIQSQVIAGALGVLVTVAVYEGKSALSTGAHRAVASASKEVLAATRDGEGDAIEAARKELADSLMRCQERVARQGEEDGQETARFMSIAGNEFPSEGASEPAPSQEERFDPTQDEWKDLAKRGQVKLSRPCAMGDDWVPAEQELQSVGLKDSDARSVAEAFKAANARSREMTRANCAEWLGVPGDVADRIGTEYCEGIMDTEAQKEEQVFRHVAEMRAGQRPEEPSALPPVERYYLAKTKELKDFESDLTRRIGADRARKITQSTSFCMIREQWPEGQTE